MNIEGLEKTEGKVCTKCGIWKPLEEYHKHKGFKDGRNSKCKDCKNKPPKETREGMKKCTKCNQWKPLEEYHKQKTGKDGRRSKCKECAKEQSKQHYQNNKEHCKEYNKQHYQNNKDHIKEYYQNNKEQKKQYYQNNKEHIKERDKQHYQNNKQTNLQYISSIVEQISPVFKQLNLPVYGYVYMFENIKTKHKYLGQSILPLKERYKSNIIQGWIEERMKYDNQKFKEELIKEDFEVTEILDIAFCQYHLDKLEVYYIDKYDSYNNGYNNNCGYHNTTDGLDEFNEILKTYNLQYIDGKIIKAPTSR